MKDTVYVTMDMDWACDGVLADTVSLVEDLNIPVCFFVTNDTPCLKTLAEHPLFTLGIHPNFMPPISGQVRKSFTEIMEEMLRLVPDAKILRCHALVDATPILADAQARGMAADMNLFIPYSSGICLVPFRHFSGIRRLPFFYEDDAWALEENVALPEEHLSAEGLKIFNFHPIHLYLNTEKMERYQRAKPFYHDFESLGQFVNHGPEMGARDFLLRLKRAADAWEIRFGKVSELWN